jgi:hypothetical protein
MHKCTSEHKSTWVFLSRRKGTVKRTAVIIHMQTCIIQTGEWTVEMPPGSHLSALQTGRGSAVNMIDMKLRVNSNGINSIHN